MGKATGMGAVRLISPIVGRLRIALMLVHACAVFAGAWAEENHVVHDGAGRVPSIL
jgi:hypothetical protein